jgi:K+-sensing histidine kinase KdpD
MKVRIKLILLLLLTLFILFNFIYLSFAIINSLSFDLISIYSKNDNLQHSLDENIKKYHTLIIFTLVIVGYIWILSKPLIHILEWITFLGEDKYEEPTNKKGVPRSHSIKNKKLKLSFFIFSGIINNLQYLTETLKYNKKERERLEKIKKEWISDIAHDLKTPLSYVKGYSSMLLSDDKWTEEEKKKFLLLIEEKADYIESLLLNLNDVFEFDEVSLLINKEQHDLVKFTRDVLIEFANDPLTEGYEVQLVNDYDDCIFYDFDGPVFKRVLNNLLINVVTHNPVGTCAEISIVVDDLFVVVEVKDDGKGIDQDKVRDIFNRKNKKDPQSQNQMPTGLGMSIVKQFVEAHGGNLTINSEINIGTSVMIYFPIH